MRSTSPATLETLVAFGIMIATTLTMIWNPLVGWTLILVVYLAACFDYWIAHRSKKN